MSSVAKSRHPLLIPDQNSIVPYVSNPNPVNYKTQEAVKSRPIFRSFIDVAEGIFKSRVFRTVASLALVGLGIGLLFALVSNPVGWIATAVGVSLLAAKLILSASAISAFALFGFAAQVHPERTIEFEISAIRKLLSSKNYNEIPVVKSQNHLYLGAIPNALTNYKTMQEIVGRNGTVIAVMEDWEITQQGLSIPMTRKDYDELGIACIRCSAPDHVILPPYVLDQLADQIHDGLEKGNVYIHCRGGAGRSAAGVAAYLMKYEGKSSEEACAWIKKNRSKATIWNKLNGLRNYQNHLKTNYKIALKPISPKGEKAADLLQKLEKAGRRPKLPKVKFQALHRSTLQRL